MPVSLSRVHRFRHAAGAVTFVLFSGLVALAGVGVLSGYRTFVVQSGSMGAAAPIGSVVLARPASAEQIAVGDMIVIRKPGKTPLLHRVIERTEQAGRIEVRTKGDSNGQPDPGSYALTGEALRYDGLRVPRLGYLVASLRTPRGLLVVAAVAGAVIALAWLRRSWRREG
jgi:signal peptidase I